MLSSIDVYQKIAKLKLPQGVYDHFYGGAGNYQTMEENQASFRRLRILPKRLGCLEDVDCSTTVFGCHISMPIFIAPSAMHKMAHPIGEVGTAQAACFMRTCMALSGWSSTSLEEVSSACGGSPLCLQMNIYKDRDLVQNLLRAADSYKCRAVIVTVDTPVVARRYCDIQNNFEYPSHLSTPLFELYSGRNSAHSPEDRYRSNVLDAHASWEYIDFVKKHSSLPVVVKGILSPDDAVEALKHGVDGIIVSNHGGRQLDGEPATIEALPHVVKAVNGKVDVYLDGGVRCGADVFKALALGAKAVFVGRPIIWGLATDGFEGAKGVLQLLKDDLKQTMCLAGCSKLKDIKKSMVVHESYFHKL